MNCKRHVISCHLFFARTDQAYNQNPTPSNSVFINVFFRISNKQNVEQAANDEQANIINKEELEKATQIVENSKELIYNLDKDIKENF